MNKLLSKDIIKQSIKNHWKLWAILTGVLCVMIMVPTISMAGRTPSEGSGSGFSLSIMNMYAMTFFDGMGAIIMIIYAVAVASKLVASEVDKGTLSLTLNTPTTRKQIIFSKALFYITSLVTMALTVSVLGMLAGLITGAEVVWGKYWLLFLGYLLYGFAISGICYFASCWFNKVGQTIMLGAGLPIAFFLLNSLTMIDGFEFFKYLSLNALFDTSAILSGDLVVVQFIALAVIGIVLYGIGINKFLKKDLPL